MLTVRPFIRSPRSGMDETEFIALVEQHPILYDTRLKGYKNVDMKNAVWKEITQALLLSEEQSAVEKLKNKWKNLRDTFVKSQKKKCRPNVRPWKLESSMQFLLPHLNTKARRFPTISPSLYGMMSSYYAQQSNSNGESSPVNLSPTVSDDLTLSPLMNSTEVSPIPLRPNSSEGCSGLQALDLKVTKKEDENADEDIDEEEHLKLAAQHVETVMADTPIVRKRKREEQHNREYSRDTSDSASVPLIALPLAMNILSNPPQVFPSRELDSLDNYFLAVAQLVKKLNPVHQAILRSEITRLVCLAEIKEIALNNNDIRVDQQLLSRRNLQVPCGFTNHSNEENISINNSEVEDLSTTNSFEEDAGVSTTRRSDDTEVSTNWSEKELVNEAGPSQ